MSEKQSEQFDKCRALGLSVEWLTHGTPGLQKCGHFIRAADVEKILSEGTPMFGAPTKDGQWSSVQRDENNHIMVSSNFINDTHTGLLIYIKPIKPKDTADEILKGMISAWGTEFSFSKMEQLVQRAKRLTGGGK